MHEKINKILILTDGGRGVGLGHLTRCLSLVQSLKKNGMDPLFIISGDESISSIVQDEKHVILNWHDKKAETYDYIRDSYIVIVDSYLEDMGFYQKISDIVKTPVYIDDTNRMDYPRGTVVNGSVNADKLAYNRRNDVRYFLGTRYVPLREDFWEVADKVIAGRITKVLVTLGGIDSRNMVPKVLKALKSQKPHIKKDVIISDCFRNTKKIEDLKDDSINFIYSPNSALIKQLMLEADVAISASGQTLYELARVGVPTVAITVAENQMTNIKGWREVGFVEDAGWWEDKTLLKNILRSIDVLSSCDERLKRKEIGRKFVDGKGAHRIIKELLN